MSNSSAFLSRFGIAVAPACRRHRPQQTSLNGIVPEYSPRFVQEIERSGGYLPGVIRQEFEDYLKCGLLQHGFLRVKSDGCRREHPGSSPGQALVAFNCKRRGFRPSCGARRSWTTRTGSAAPRPDSTAPGGPPPVTSSNSSIPSAGGSSQPRSGMACYARQARPPRSVMRQVSDP